MALALCFVSTWYISYMIGIFCALYLCARLYVLRPKGRELGRIAARFFGGRGRRKYAAASTRAAEPQNR